MSIDYTATNAALMIDETEHLLKNSYEQDLSRNFWQLLKPRIFL